MSSARDRVPLVAVTLRDGTVVKAQWWADAEGDRAWFRPVDSETVGWSPCRPGSSVLVDVPSMREDCCPQHAAELPPVEGHGTADLLGLLGGES
jgi:hypothetical protein